MSFTEDMDECIGKIIKGVGGLYVVYAEGLGPVECRAKGILRYNDVKPLIGDDVKLRILDREKRIGNLTEVLPRKNALIRPAVANVDQALVVFAVREPEPHLNLLDRFLILMEKEQVPVLICFNKTDKAGGDDVMRLRNVYAGSGCRMFFTDARNPDTVAPVYEALLGKTTVLAGPSGVGKSTIMNDVQPEAAMETGGLSEKILRGKNTTRHSELHYVAADTYLCDTPGFSSLFLPDISATELSSFYPEMAKRKEQCRFPDCVHRKEPGCAVKAAVETGEIAPERYANYNLLFEELSARRKW